MPCCLPRFYRKFDQNTCKSQDSQGRKQLPLISLPDLVLINSHWPFAEAFMSCIQKWLPRPLIHNFPRHKSETVQPVDRSLECFSCRFWRWWLHFPFSNHSGFCKLFQRRPRETSSRSILRCILFGLLFYEARFTENSLAGITVCPRFQLLYRPFCNLNHKFPV